MSGVEWASNAFLNKRNEKKDKTGWERKEGRRKGRKKGREGKERRKEEERMNK